jgi:hypothetical protein
MAKMLGMTLLGLALMIGGFFLGYLFLEGLDSGGSPLLILPTFPLVGGGTFVLMKAGKKADRVIGREDLVKQESTTPNATGGLAGRIQENNEIVAQYAKTAKTRDELKLLEIQANGEK